LCSFELDSYVQRGHSTNNGWVIIFQEMRRHLSLRELTLGLLFVFNTPRVWGLGDDIEGIKERKCHDTNCLTQSIKNYVLGGPLPDPIKVWIMLETFRDTSPGRACCKVADYVVPHSAAVGLLSRTLLTPIDCFLERASCVHRV
jgi:hypothetical protein